MNDKLENFARSELKKGLAKLQEKHHKMFKRMYSSKNLTLAIDEVVDEIPKERLSFAMEQVERSIAKECV